MSYDKGTECFTRHDLHALRQRYGVLHTPQYSCHPDSCHPATCAESAIDTSMLPGHPGKIKRLPNCAIFDRNTAPDSGTI